MATAFSSTSSTRMGTRRAFSAAGPRSTVVSAPVNRTRVVRVSAGLFDFLAPKSSAPVANPRKEELSGALIDICSKTDAGSKASQTTKEEIEDLVAELAQFSVKNPVRSPLLWGTYDVLYCSKPTAVGGPLKKGAGPVIAPGQQARQILEEPNSLVNEVTFKTLGFIPGYSRQYGTIQPVSGDTFILRIQEGELNFGIGAQQKQFDITRKIQVLYLDDTLRIARFLPSEDLTDQEAEEAQGGPEDEEILFVFSRIAEQEAQQEAAEEPEEEEEERAPAPVLGLFGGTRKIESLATQVERQVESQRTRKGTQAFFLGGRQEEEEEDDPRAAQQKERAEAQARKQREQEERRAAAERARQEAAAAKAAEQARMAKEKEAAAKARAAQEARERAEKEKAERAARAAAIREQLAELAEELKEKQAASREASKAAREVVRENQAVLKQVAQAEASIKEAEQEVQQVSAALDEAGAARKAAEQQLKQAQQAVKDAETAYRQKVAAR